MTMQTTTPVEIRHFHLFCGLGGGARGFNRASPRVGNLQAKFRCLGGIDVDPASIRDFGRLAGVPGTVLDLFDREQYRTFHGAEPPADWREATAADIQRAAGGERPNIVFLSAPCKGFSGLLSEGKSKTDKYQALNRLTLRGVWLMLEAWRDDPPELVIFENVPRIATRGRHLLDQIVALLRAYGYAVAETTHDCGEIGGLAQSRRRFLLVARHAEKVPSFLYQPRSKPLRAVGDVLGRMLLPGDLRAGPMHRVPSLQWKTWVRLAFVQAGSDWRSLNRLAIEDGTLRDYLIVPEMHAGMLGVQDWTRHSSTVTGKGRPSCGNFAVADPRFEQSALWSDGQAYGVRRWDASMGTVAGQQGPGQGAYSVADPRHHGPAKHSNEYRVVRWDRAAMAVTSAHGTGQAVADPRRDGPCFGKYAVTPYGTHAGTVISGSTTGQGAFAVADPRSGMDAERTAYTTGGHYGVVPWDSQAGAVSGAACHDNGRWSVADPRMPAAADKLVCRIVSEDGTWHRPFTTLELAHLQSLVEPDELLELDGTSDQAKRERIGNAVPSEAGEAIAHVMGETLLLALSGETFILSAQPVWVRPIALGLAMGTTA
ncbi:DNA cytosine methyltransferase [Delftia tsuruhatensis]|jgi:site-specific DNA-cytosine methylase|uniref:DNA cytosine methyltransferase n=1 Tax=Delftia TaxID=80865 RepID=UPI0006478559|nr:MULTISPECIES: DNA cytosine methyltransferase [Delftia]MDH0777156.1 DNA cytosine methyltransferase [Delftia tsuruhatensis]MDH1461158.1 DNA cytosine methyltransferase [Delftia tsuruhatensis]WGG09045.1 DNA cytosine methyltransferase [Delftia tsuruhatensis]